MPVLVVAALVALALALPAQAAWDAGTSVGGALTVLRASDAEHAYAGGANGLLMRTSDGGQTWNPVTPPSDANIRDIAGVGLGNLVYVVDSRGDAFVSYDGGGSWAPVRAPVGAHPLGIAVGSFRVAVARRSIYRIRFKSDGSERLEEVTPKLARTDGFSGIDRGGGSFFAWGPRTLLRSERNGAVWRHMKLPPRTRGDQVLAAEFLSKRRGYVLTSFRRLWLTTDAGHHWRELLGTGGAGSDIAFGDSENGWLAAPGFANRFDGYVLRTTDGGLTWRPQPVAARFVSAVEAHGTNALAIGNEGMALFANPGGGEPGTAVTVGFRPSPRVARRGKSVAIRGRINPAISGAGVAVSMRSAGRWITRFVTTNAHGVFSAKFSVQRRAWFIAQVPGAADHGSAATKPVLVRVTR